MPILSSRCLPLCFKEREGKKCINSFPWHECLMKKQYFFLYLCSSCFVMHLHRLLNNSSFLHRVPSSCSLHSPHRNHVFLIHPSSFFSLSLAVSLILLVFIHPLLFLGISFSSLLLSALESIKTGMDDDDDVRERTFFFHILICNRAVVKGGKIPLFFLHHLPFHPHSSWTEARNESFIFLAGLSTLSSVCKKIDTVFLSYL